MIRNKTINEEMSIIHTNKDDLRREFIDQSKAISVMSNLKQTLKMNKQEEKKEEEDFIRTNNTDNQGIASAMKNKEWQEFLEFVESNPETMFNLVPSTPVNNPTETLISPQSHQLIGKFSFRK